MKRFCHILPGLAVLAAVSVQAMPLGLRLALWNRSARTANALAAPVIMAPATYEAESCRGPYAVCFLADL